jgi:methylphosphotriester-DNA--protein-cysteine methyltransferase
MPATLRPDLCYRALVARDRRFDGVCLVGVTSTRIYCRPICTVRAARREHYRYFPHPALAEHAGLRPCLRCRPGVAPGAGAVDAVDELTRAAVARIEAGALADGGKLDGLAAELGVSARHLRCSMHHVLGLSPVALALARAVESGAIDLRPGTRPLAAMERLQVLPGIGPWTASYLTMRVLRWPDAFPAGDLGIRQALGGVSARDAAARSEAWRPWRAYAAQQLWQSLLP